MPGLYNVHYMQRLQLLKLETLEARRIQMDLTLLFKIIHNKVDINIQNYFTFNNNNTRGHRLKLNVQHSRINCRKYFFINRTIPIWNHLPFSILDAGSLFNFKKMLNNVNLNEYCKGRAYTA